MRERRVGAVLVTEADNRLLGIFTGRDAVHRVLAEGKSAARTKLAEVMTPEPDTMPPGKTAIEALRLMEHGRYRHMPASISAASNWIAWTRRRVCGRGSDA
jgi:CBS domain-containing protein